MTAGRSGGPPIPTSRSRRSSPPPRSGSGPPKLTVEQRAIAGLCRDAISVAEIAARLDLPLGVTRILVGDMADEDFVTGYRPRQGGDRPDLALLERVLYGLRTI
jgi:Protein of unknown function (DUF742)